MNPYNQNDSESSASPEHVSERIGDGAEVAKTEYGLSAAVETGASTPTVAPPMFVPPQQPVQGAQDEPVAQPAAQAPAGTPHIADDADLIEKEWVLKAKEIVEQTRTDPYTQSEAMTRMKADYMKKRYNKDIKLPQQG